MVADIEAIGFATLGGNVADVDDLPNRRTHSTGDPIDQEIRQDTGEKAPRPQDNQVGVEDRPNRRRVSLSRTFEMQPFDRAGCIGDIRLATDERAIAHIGAEGHLIQRCWQDLTAYRQHAADLGHRLFK